MPSTTKATDLALPAQCPRSSTMPMCVLDKGPDSTIGVVLPSRKRSCIGEGHPFRFVLTFSAFHLTTNSKSTTIDTGYRSHSNHTQRLLQHLTNINSSRLHPPNLRQCPLTTTRSSPVCSPPPLRSVTQHARHGPIPLRPSNVPTPLV